MYFWNWGVVGGWRKDGDRKVCKSCDVLLYVTVLRHKRAGWGGPQHVLPLSLNPTLLHPKKTGNNKSKRRTPLVSSNGFRSCLPMGTADERIIKPRGVLTERSHAVQAAIHATTVCLLSTVESERYQLNLHEQCTAFCKNRGYSLTMSDEASQ